jgi:hypothetical protein
MLDIEVSKPLNKGKDDEKFKNPIRTVEDLKKISGAYFYSGNFFEGREVIKDKILHVFNSRIDKQRERLEIIHIPDEDSETHKWPDPLSSEYEFYQMREADFEGSYAGLAITEALKNASMHGRPHYDIAAAWRGNVFYLYVRDQGEGFGTSPVKMDGMGLNIIEGFCTEFGYFLDEKGFTVLMIRDFDDLDLFPNVAGMYQNQDTMDQIEAHYRKFGSVPLMVDVGDLYRDYYEIWDEDRQTLVKRNFLGKEID